MDFLLNFLFALLAFFLVRWLAGEVGAPNPVAVVLAVIAAVIVFFADLAVRVLH